MLFCITTCEGLRDFLPVGDFFMHASGCFIFASTCTARAIIPPFQIAIYVKVHRNETKVFEIKVIYNLTTLPPTVTIATSDD